MRSIARAAFLGLALVLVGCAAVVERDGPGMADTLQRLEFWSRAVEGLPRDDRRAWELLNMLTVARLATIGALQREESRGVHHRRDFPELDAAGPRNLELRPRGSALRLRSIEVVRTSVPGALPTA